MTANPIEKNPSTLKELGTYLDLDLTAMLIPSSQVSGNLGGGTDNTPTYTIYKTGASFAARANVTGLSDVAQNADAAAVLQSCMDNMNSSTTPRGLIIFAPNTTFTWSSIPNLRRTYASGGSDDNKWLRILGSGGSVIQFAGVNSAEFMHINRQADYDGFCGIEIGNLDFDGNNLAAGGSTVLGVVGAYTRVDFRRVYIHDVSAYNFVTHTNASGKYRAFLWLENQHLAASEATQSQITDITVERCRALGGNCGILVAGLQNAGPASYPGTNIYGNRWRVSDFYFDNNVAAGSQSTLPPSSCIQLGGIAFGEQIVVERCWLSGSADDGLEINNFRRVTVRNVHLSKCYGGGYNPVQFNYVNGVDNTQATSQEFLFQDCYYEHVAGMEVGAIDRAFVIQGYGHDGVDQGTLIFRRCVSYCSGKINTNCAQLGGGFYFATGIASNLDRVVLEGCTFDSWHDNTSGAGEDIRPIWCYKMGRHLIIKDCNIVLRGAQVSGTYFVKAAYLGGQGSSRLDIDGLTVEDLTTGRSNNTTYLVYLGDSGTNDFGGTIRRLIQLSATSDVAPRGIFISRSSALTLRKLLIEDCDWTRLTNDAGHIVFENAGQNEAPVFVRNLKARVDPPAEIAFTPGATTVAAQYLGHYEGNMTVTGGTVTVVSVSTDNVTYRQIAAGTNVSFYVDHGHWIKLTYTVVPTCVVIPRR